MIPRRKSIAPGVVLIFIGLGGLVLGATAYPVWQDNTRVLRMKEALGLATEEDYDTVRAQMLIVLGGIFVGAFLTILGVILVVGAMSFNSRLDEATLARMPPAYPLAQHQINTLRWQQPVEPGQKLFCSNCGAPRGPGAVVCAICGRRLT